MSGTTPFTDRYKADVKARGGVYIAALPKNTNLGTDALGSPGARLPDATARIGWTYELAPIAVRLEQGFELGKETAAGWLYGTLTEVGEATTGALGAAARATLDGIGIPPHVLGLVLVLVGYLALRQAGIVPPLSRVLK